MGASAALAQQHLKRMLAYSTLSQLGYIVAAIGLGNAAIGLTYLVVHAFAKACLFLIAGNIALFLQTKGISEQKAYIISYMGGIGYRLPIAATSYLIATWGLGVIPGLIGSTAKEHILAQSFVWAHLQEEYLYYLIPSLGLVSTGLTILYMGQAFVHIFLGTPGWKNLPPISLSSRASHQNTWLLQGSMVVCASCVLLSSYLLDNWTTSTTASFAWPLQAPIGTWQSMTLIGQEKVYHMLLLIADGLSLLVILWLLISQFKSIARFAKVIPWTAWLQDKAPASHKDSLMLYKIFLNGWYLEACTTFLGRRVLACSRLAAQIEIYLMNGLLNGLAHVYIKVADVVHWLDHALMEGLGNGIAILSQQGSRLYLHLQNGRTQLYIMWTCIGMGLLVVIWTLLIE
jgi:NADH-quinone oxidoreductase subunit L